MTAPAMTSPWVVVSLCVLLAALSGCGGAEARKAKHMERGEAYLAEGNLDKARIEFRNALQIDPNNAQARFMSGRVAEKLNNLREAAGMYQAAIDADPGHLAARAELGRILVFAGASDRALELVEPSLAKGEDAALLTVRGAARMQRGNVEGALADASRALELEPLNENALALIASILQQKGELQRAVDVLSAALQTMPKNSDLRVILAQLYEQGGDRPRAEAELKRIVEMKPRERMYRAQLVLFYLADKQVEQAQKVLEAGVAADSGSVDARLALAEFLAVQRSPQAAEQVLRGYIAERPQEQDLRFGLARLFESIGDPAKAQAVYREVIEADGLKANGLTARNRIAALQAQAGQYQDAEVLIGEVLRENPRDNDALIIRGNIALARNLPSQAINDLRAVLSDQPNAIPVRRALARAHLQNGEPALAEENLKLALDANPKDVDTRLDLAQLVSGRGENAQALQMLEQLVREVPTNVQARDLLFRAQLLSNDFDAAARTAEDLKLLRPDQSLGFYYGAVAARARKDDAGALRQFEKALALQPEAAEPLAGLVQLLLERRETDVVVARLEAIRAKYPKHAVARNLLGDVLITQRKTAEARVAFEAAIRLSPAWWPPYRGIAVSYAADGAQEKTIAAYRRGIEAVNDPATLSADLAAVYELSGRADEAISEYERLMDRNPGSAVGANNLAMLLVTYRSDQKSLDRARELVVRFADSADPALINTHGWVMYKRGDYAAALPLLEHAVQKVPNSPVMRYHLGMAQYRAGQLDRARENLEQSLGAPTRFAGIDEARATLDALRKKG